MATETSSIDDILAGVKTPAQPETHENQYVEEPPPESNEVEEPESEDSGFERDYIDPNEEADEELTESPAAKEVDEYGNEAPPEKMYTLAELNDAKNKAVRERLARMKEDMTPQQAQQLQQHAQTFNADPNSTESWQDQLEQFVEQTFNKISQKEVARQHQDKERQAHEEFTQKFTDGMGRFGDFREVVGSQPFDDPMTYALRGMKDPAAFAYAASKRHPEELKRISSLSDPYAKMVEMGKLEERMRKKPSSTNAPRPITRTPEDTTSKVKPKETSSSIEDMIARSDARRMAQLKQRRNR